MIPICRIFGISYKGDTPEALTATEIALIMYPALIHQGPHAWGWMQYDGEGDISFHKEPGRATTNGSRAVQRELIAPKCGWLVGHVRYATHGKPEHNINNHPIAHGNVIGVHNGVLRNHEDILAKTGREDPSCIVDSEAIFAAVNKWGPKKGLAKIRGDMVAVYADSRKPNDLTIARTHGRQITLGWTEKGNIVFASEEQALHQIEPEVRFTKFSTVSENRLLVIRNGEIIRRTTFRTPEHTVPAPLPVAARPLSGIPTAKGDDWDVIDRMARRRASARGEILFPKDSGKKKGRTGRMAPKEIEEEIHEIVEADGSVPTVDSGKGRLYYFRGELMTHGEYMQALEMYGD